MKTIPKTYEELLEENERLRTGLEEAEATIEAIRGGEVDAVVVYASPVEQIYTLEGADRPYRLLVEAMQQGVATLNREGVILYCNPYFANLLQAPQERVSGASLEKFLTDADKPVWAGMLARANPEPVQCEVQMRRAEDGLFPAALLLNPLPFRGALCLSVTDLTQQKQTEELKRVEAALRESEEQTRRTQRMLYNLVERCPFGIYIVDADFRIATMNAGSQTGAFVNVRPVIGRPFDQAMRILWPERVAADIIKNFRNTLDTGEPYYSKDFVNPRADIDVTEGYEWELHRITLPDGQHGVVCYYYDSTKLRQVERALREADQKKNEFLSVLAHELRNPLSPLHNGLQLMKLAKTDANVVEQARSMMERQLSQMVHLIDDLMDLTRITQGKIVLRKTRMAVAAAVRNAADTSRPLIEQQGHDLTIDVPDEPIYVDGDETRLTQVFANLLNNAAKYTDRCGRIRLAVEQQGSDVLVTVEDNGVGIPAHMLPKVFEMFTQVDRSLERAQGGLGIGLKIVKQLVEMHGECIVGESGGHGMGSKFTVRLPVVLARAVERQELEGNDKPTTTKARRRIPVVDDSRDAASSLAMLLNLMGNETQTAHDGLEALELGAAFKPDVVLLDIGMPKLNGYDAARRIRQEAWGKSIVLVACTGWGQEEDKRKSQQAGFNLHIVKPVDPAALEKLLAGLQATTILPA
jgi:signal transduction histidine kinase/ActR/RegA family two-component response regulator